MNYDISQPVPQGSDGAQDAENSRIAAIADQLELLCAIHEAQRGDSLKDVRRTSHSSANNVYSLINYFIPIIN